MTPDSPFTGAAPSSQGPPGHALAEAAEEVRAWFVTVRGGAPFLSSADGLALADWLEGGTSVVRLLRAIEETAARRLARRARSPFTLRSVRTALAGKAGPPASATPPADPLRIDGEAELAAEAGAAVAAIRGDDPELVARARCVVARAFHDALWERAADARASLLAEAREARADAADLDEALYADLCEQWARERLRRRHPMLTATHIWGAAAS